MVNIITIEIAHQVIQLDLIYEDKFSTLNKYQIDKKPVFFIKSHLGLIARPQDLKPTQTTFYDVYKLTDKTIQIQKNAGQAIGGIVYQDNKIDIYLQNESFVTEYLLTQYAFVYIIRNLKNVLFMHGSSLKYKTMGIIFSAKSGTGKSTHSRLWQAYSDSVVINDDKNVILYENDKLFLYPNPWSGKHQIDNNIVAELKCLVFLYQSKENIVKRIKPIEATRLLLGQVELPREENKENWDFMIDRLLELPVYYYGCNMDKSAFETLKERLEYDLCK